MTQNQGKETVTRLLNAWLDGDRVARNKAMIEVYEELRRRAGYLGKVKANNVTLKPTEIVHETFLKFDSCNRERWANRQEFYFTFTKAMKNGVIDYLRAETMTAKRGKNVEKVPFIDEITDSLGGSDVLLEIIETAEELAKAGALTELQMNILLSRFILCSSIKETADALDIGKTKVNDEWNLAKAILFDELSEL